MNEICRFTCIARNERGIVAAPRMGCIRVSTRARYRRLIWLRWGMASLNSGQNWADSLCRACHRWSLFLCIFYTHCIRCLEKSKLGSSRNFFFFCNSFVYQVLNDSLKNISSSYIFINLSSMSRYDWNLPLISLYRAYICITMLGKIETWIIVKFFLFLQFIRSSIFEW